MKTYSSIWMLAAVALTLGGCSTAYRAQTPDAVYYSPAADPGAADAGDEGAGAVTDGTGEGQYVTYQDSYNGYADDYDGLYSQRISMFDMPGSYGSYNRYAMMSPLYGSYGYGLGWNPYAFAMPSLSMMWTFGSPWGGYYSPMAWGGYYRPYLYGGYYGGYYSSYYPGYYGSYYPGYYGYGGKYMNITPRPAGSYGPRSSVNSRAATVRRTGSAVSTRPATGVSAPRRSFQVSGNRSSTETTQPASTSRRRTFRTSSSERPVNVNTNSRVSERSSVTPSRTRTTRSVERQPVSRPAEQPRTYQRATPRVEVQRSAPSPSYSAPRSAPSRSFSPRGR